MTTRCEIAPGHWLAPGPAASWGRMRAAGMPAGGITEAGRTRARQEYLYGEYLAGRLLAYAARPGESLHETGHAIDIATSSAAQAWLIAHGAEHGWYRPLLHARKPEPWHWEYSAARDRHLLDGIDPLTPLEDTDMDRVIAALAALQATVQNIENLVARDGGGGIRADVQDTRALVAQTRADVGTVANEVRALARSLGHPVA